MFDSLFGSEKEKRIEELEEKLEEKEKSLENLRKELDKEKDRAKAAITEKQRTDKELKNYKHKLESKEEKIKNITEKEEDQKSKRVLELSQSESKEFVNLFSTIKSDNKNLITHYTRKLDEIEDKQVKSKVKKLNSGTGFVHINDNFNIINCLIIPPLPIKNSFHREKKFFLEKLKENLKGTEKKLLFISLHAGKSGIGVIKEEDFQRFKVIKSRIRNKHSKGGFSQQRFQRNRKKQIDEHLEKVIEKTKDFNEKTDLIILNGNSEMKSTFKNKFSTDTKILDKSLDIKKIQGPEKNKYINKIFSTKLFIL